MSHANADSAYDISELEYKNFSKGLDAYTENGKIKYADFYRSYFCSWVCDWCTSNRKQKRTPRIEDILSRCKVAAFGFFAITEKINKYSKQTPGLLFEAYEEICKPWDNKFAKCDDKHKERGFPEYCSHLSSAGFLTRTTAVLLFELLEKFDNDIKDRLSLCYSEWFISLKNMNFNPKKNTSEMKYTQEAKIVIIAGISSLFLFIEYKDCNILEEYKKILASMNITKEDWVEVTDCLKHSTIKVWDDVIECWCEALKMQKYSFKRIEIPTAYKTVVQVHSMYIEVKKPFS